MRQPRAHKSRKRATGATNITARIPDELVDTAPSDFDVGCVSCTLVFEDMYTVNLCGDHIWCINCAIDQFTAATEDVELFPVNCCGKSHVLALQAVQYLLPSRVVQLYSTKLAEWTTERKVWCSNKDCGQFLPKRSYRKLEQSFGDWNGPLHVGTVGYCKKCGKETCLNCGQDYVAYLTHICKLTTEMMIELPPYADDCRFKQCPGCKTPVELRDACNHMVCVCGYQYCFVCLLKWDGGHDCPEYGDPLYDANGRDNRGLHVRTGLDEGGYDRLGQHKYYPSRAPQPSLREPFSPDGTFSDDAHEEFAVDDAVVDPGNRDWHPVVPAWDPHAGDPWTVPPDPNHPNAVLVEEAFEAAVEGGDQQADGPLIDLLNALTDDLPLFNQDNTGRPDEREDQPQPQIREGFQAEPAVWDEAISDSLPSPEATAQPPAPSIFGENFEDGIDNDGEGLSVENAMISMFENYEKRFNRLTPLPSITDTFNIEDLASSSEEIVTYRDRSLVTIALLRPGRKTISYEIIDLGHMTWFEILAMSPIELDKLNSSVMRSWKAVHSRKYAYDTIYGFEAQGVDMYLEEANKENTKWEERQGDRALEETVMVRGTWRFEDDTVEVIVAEDDTVEVIVAEDQW